MEKWFIWLTLGLSVLVLLVSFTQKVENYLQARSGGGGNNPKNCQVNPISNSYLTSLVIGGSDSTAQYCPSGTSPLPGAITQPITNRITSLCYVADQNVCDDTVLYEDVKFVDMTDPATGKYKAQVDRCPAGYSLPFASLLPVPQLTDAGLLGGGSGGSSCPKMGVCVKVATGGMNDQQNALKIKDLQIATSTDAQGDQNLTGDEICTKWLAQTGFTTDKVNVLGTPSCSNNQAFYLCKRK